MVIEYRPEIVDQYPGLELMNPDNVEGARVIRMDDITSHPQNFVLDKFQRVLVDAYYGRINPVDGGPNGEGLTVINGLHRVLVCYVLSGRESHMVMRGYNSELWEVQRQGDNPTMDRLEGLVRREGLREFARHELACIDEAAHADQLFKFWDPCSWIAYARAVAYRDNKIRYHMRTNYSRKITQAHMNRLLVK